MTTECDIEYLSKELNKRKGDLSVYLKKHFKEDIHYTSKILQCYNITNGGQNRRCYTLSKECIELIKNSYNLKHKYITKNNELIQTNIVMTLENSTIGFLCNCLKNITQVYRQYKVGLYYVDLFIPIINIVIECDEEGHNDRNKNDEKTREEFIINELDCVFIRFNPNDKSFDLSEIINKNLILLSATNLHPTSPL